MPRSRSHKISSHIPLASRISRVEVDKLLKARTSCSNYTRHTSRKPVASFLDLLWQGHATEVVAVRPYQARVVLKLTCRHLLTTTGWLRKTVVSKVATHRLILMVSIEAISRRTLVLPRV